MAEMSRPVPVIRQKNLHHIITYQSAASTADMIMK